MNDELAARHRAITLRLAGRPVKAICAAVGPIALRPGIAAGLPFRGCEAAGLGRHMSAIFMAGWEPIPMSNDEKHANQIEAPTRRPELRSE